MALLFTVLPSTVSAQLINPEDQLLIGNERDAVNADTDSTDAEKQKETDALDKRAEALTGTVDTETNLKIGIIEGILYTIATGLGGIFLWLGGTIFDFTISYTVIGMGELLGNGAGGLGQIITAMWEIVRDLFNMLFIFGFIYIGFKTILSPADTSARRTLGTLIIAALLINFSLYATKVIVDFSNIAATQIYDLMDTGEGISATFMAYSNLSSYANPQAELLNAWSSERSWLPSMRVIGFAFMMMIFMLMAAFVFLAGAFFLLARFVTIVICLILSPIMFLGMVLPGFKKYQDDWWSKFLSSAFLAPAFMFMLYISLNLVQALQKPVGSFAEAFKGAQTGSGKLVFSNADSAAVFMGYLMVIGFLYASLLVAKSMGAAGADRAIGMAKAAAKNTQGYIASSTVGRAAGGLSTSFSNLEEKTGVPLPFSRSIRGGLDSVHNAKFGGSSSSKERGDYTKKRKGELIKSTQTAAIASAINDAGDALAHTGTRTTAQDNQIIAMEEKIAGANKNQIIDLAKSKSTQSSLEAVAGSLSSSQFDAVINSDDVSDDFKVKLRSARASTTMKTLGLTPGTPAGMQGIGKASKEQIKNLDFATVMEGARYLTTDQLKSLEGAFTPYQITVIKEKRQKDMIPTTNAIAHYKNLTEKMKESDIAKLPPKILEDGVFIEALRQDKKITVSLLKKIASENDANKKIIRKAIETSVNSSGDVEMKNTIAKFFAGDSASEYQ